MSNSKLFPSANAAFLDTAEKYILTIVFVFFAYRMVQGYLDSGTFIALAYLFDQLVILTFVILRRPTEKVSIRVDDWIFGFSSTFLALLLAAPSGGPVIPLPAVWALLIAGFVIHVGAKLSLRRSFGVVAANRGVKASGFYYLVRHPMYLGYVVSQTGFVLAGPSLYNVAVIAACWLLFVKRIQAEERLLMQDTAYQDFATRTKYRLIPGVY